MSAASTVASMSDTDSPTAALAVVLLDEPQAIDVALALRPLMAPALHTDLCRAMELCPMHICDERICADDGVSSCASVRD